MPTNSEHKLAYLELPCADPATLKAFYGPVFGWQFQDWGPDYVAVSNAGLDGGFNADPASRPKAPLPIVQTTDLAATQKAIEDGGGTVTLPIFSFPGGRRFHFTDPAGNELAVVRFD